MKIGLIGPEVSCSLIEQHIHEIDPMWETKRYIREQVKDAPEVVEECERECDAIIFSGCAMESYVQGQYELKRPYTYIERSINSVAGAFLHMAQQNMELDAFSIDIVEKQVIEDLLDSFHIKAKNIFSSSFQPGVDEQEYVEWHRKLQDENKTNIALTSFVWVYKSLLKRGYQVFYLAPTKAMSREALERIKKECALNKAEDAQIAVELFQFSNYEERQDNYYKNMLSRAQAETEIVKYVQGIQGSLFNFGRDEYVVFANAGSVEKQQNYSRLYHLKKSVKNYGLLLHVGIGMGTTAYKAELNARKALEIAVKRNRPEIYQINAESTLSGPLGAESQLTYNLISSDSRIQDLSLKTGLSAESVLKIIAIAEVQKSYVFDAQQLAQCLEVTPRSARRILNKIVSAGLGTVYAKETSAAGGRPKALIELLFRE